MRWHPLFLLPALGICASVVGVGYATWYFEQSQYQEIVIDNTKTLLSAKATVGDLSLVIKEGYGEDPGKGEDNPELLLIIEQTWVGFDDQVEVRFTPFYDLANDQFAYPRFENYVFRLTISIAGGLEDYLEVLESGEEDSLLDQESDTANGKYVFDWTWSEEERNKIVQEGDSYVYSPNLLFRYQAGMVPEDEKDVQELFAVASRSTIHMDFSVTYQEIGA